MSEAHTGERDGLDNEGRLAWTTAATFGDPEDLREAQAQVQVRDSFEITMPCETPREIVMSAKFVDIFNKWQADSRTPDDFKGGMVTVEQIQTIVNGNPSEIRHILLSSYATLSGALVNLFDYWVGRHIKWGLRHQGDQGDENIKAVEAFKKANTAMDRTFLLIERNMNENGAGTEFRFQKEHTYLDAGNEFVVEFDNFKEEDKVDFGDEKINEEVRKIPVVTDVISLIKHLAFKTDADKRKGRLERFEKKDIPELKKVIDAIVPGNYLSVPFNTGEATVLAVFNKQTFIEELVTSFDQFMAVKNFHGMKFDAVVFFGVPFAAFSNRKGSRVYEKAGDTRDKKVRYNRDRLSYNQEVADEEVEGGKRTIKISFNSDRLTTKEDPGHRYHAHCKKTISHIANEVALQKKEGEPLPIHGACFRIKLPGSDKKITFVAAGESSTGKGETLEQLRRLQNAHLIEDIEIIAGDMLHLSNKGTDGPYVAKPVERGDYVNLSNGDKEMIRYYASREGVRAFNPSKYNSRLLDPNVSRWAFDEAGKPKEFEVDFILYTNNFQLTSSREKELKRRGLIGAPEEGVKAVENAVELLNDPEALYKMFYEAERVANLSTKAGPGQQALTRMRYGIEVSMDPSYNTHFGIDFFDAQSISILEERWRKVLNHYAKKGSAGVMYTMIESGLAGKTDPTTQDKLTKVDMASEAALSILELARKAAGLNGDGPRSGAMAA